MSDLVIPDDPKASAAQPPYQILALSGGGYRGLFTAILLEELERRAAKPLAQCFDMIAGTSIGGILAIGIASGVPAAAMSAAFAAHGATIFPKRRKVLGLSLPRVKMPAFAHRYANKGLRETIRAILQDPDDQKTLAEVGPQLLVTSVNVTAHEPAIFRNGGADSVPLVDVALATSAAPTYFPEHQICKENYVDGGLIANAPDFLAIAEGLRSGESTDALRVLSLGTVETVKGQAARAAKGVGYLNGARELFELTLDTQQRLAIDECTRLLGRQRYLRVDAIASEEQMAVLGLDVVDRASQNTLQALADDVIRDQIGAHEADLRMMLGRKARWVPTDR